MSKHYIKISVLILFQLLMVSCNNKQQKMQDYVKNFNTSADFLRNEIITSAVSEVSVPDNEIKITFQTNLQQSEETKIVYNKTLPTLFADVLQRDSSSMDLLEEGVHFKVSFLADDSSELTNLIVDSKKINELMKLSLPNTATPSSNSKIRPEIQQMLALMNANMPIENKADGTKILKIEINDNEELIYKVEVPDDFAALMKMESAKELIKESLLRNGELKKIFSTVNRFGISTIKYEYLNKKGVVVSSNSITEKDLK